MLVSTALLITVGFSIGAGFGSVGEAPRERVAAFFMRNPPLIATLLGLIAPASLAPDVAVDVSRAVVIAILPIGFFAVGVTLAAEAETAGARIIAPTQGSAIPSDCAIPRVSRSAGPNRPNAAVL